MTHTCYYRRQVFTSLYEDDNQYWLAIAVLVKFHSAHYKCLCRGGKEEPKGPGHQITLRRIHKTSSKHVAFVSDDISINISSCFLFFLLLSQSSSSFFSIVWTVAFLAWRAGNESWFIAVLDSAPIELNLTSVARNTKHLLSDQYSILFSFLFFFVIFSRSRDLIMVKTLTRPFHSFYIPSSVLEGWNIPLSSELGISFKLVFISIYFYYSNIFLLFQHCFRNTGNYQLIYVY